MNYSIFGVEKFYWDPIKSASLKRTRGVSFEEILDSPCVAIVNHPKRPHQKLMLFAIGGYIWAAPCVETDGGVFLKTLYPCQQYTKKWRRGDYR